MDSPCRPIEAGDNESICSMLCVLSQGHGCVCLLPDSLRTLLITEHHQYVSSSWLSSAGYLVRSFVRSSIWTAIGLLSFWMPLRTALNSMKKKLFCPRRDCSALGETLSYNSALTETPATDTPSMFSLSALKLGMTWVIHWLILVWVARVSINYNFATKYTSKNNAVRKPSIIIYMWHCISVSSI